MNNENVLAFLQHKKIIIVEAREGEINLLNFLYENNVSVGIKNLSFISKTTYFGSILDSLNIEQLPPDAFFSVPDTEEWVLLTPHSTMREDEKSVISLTRHITSEYELFLKFSTAKKIVITGSFGKQSATQLISNILEKNNFSTYRQVRDRETILSSCTLTPQPDYILIDVPLDELTCFNFRPDILVVTNLFPYPFNEKKSFIGIVKEISNTISLSKKKCVSVINYDNYFCRMLSNEESQNTLFFSAKKPLIKGVNLESGNFTANTADKKIELGKVSVNVPGSRFIEIIMSSIAATYSFCTTETIQQAIEAFNGAEHHLEMIKEVNQRRYFDNAYAKTPAQTVSALTSLNNNIIIITGGEDKTLNFKALGMEIVYFCKAVILIGKASTNIKKAVASYPHYKKYNLPIYKAADINKAVLLARHISKSGDNILFSFASRPSENPFDYINHGESFKSAVDAL